jgi:argininosuccinate lyase
VGSAVGFAGKVGRDLAELSLEELRSFSPLVEADVYAHISLEASLAARQTYGGTAPVQVRAAIARARNQQPRLLP